MSVSPLNSSPNNNSFSTIKESRNFLLQDHTGNNNNNNLNIKQHLENFYDENPYSNLAPELQKLIKDTQANNDTFPAINMEVYDKYTKKYHNWFPQSNYQQPQNRERSWEYNQTQDWNLAGNQYTQNNSTENNKNQKDFITMEEGKSYQEVDPLNKYQPSELKNLPTEDQYHYVNLKDKGLYYYDQSTDSLIKIGQQTAPMKQLKDPNAYTLDNMSEEKLLELKHGKLESEDKQESNKPSTTLEKQLNQISKKLNQENKESNQQLAATTTTVVVEENDDTAIIIGAYVISSVSFLAMLAILIYVYFFKK
jgi:hypothetical protein